MLDGRWLPPAGSPVVVAVSGGRDSLVLWDLLAQAGYGPLIIWHLDHGLRPDTIADADVIRALERRHHHEGCAPAVVRMERAALSTARGVEAAARAWRYRRLAAVAHEVNATVVVTAHHRDDQAETVLLHLLRGAGVTGRAGIPPRRTLAPGIALVRPLLAVPREALAEYARARGLIWHEDTTNQDTRWQRNFLRHRVLPTLAQGVPDIAEGLAAIAAAAHAQVTQHDERMSLLWRVTANGLDLAPLAAATAAERQHVWRHLIRHLGLPASRRTVAALDALAHGPPGKAWAGGGWRLQRRRSAITWVREQRRLCAPRSAEHAAPCSPP